MLPNEAEQKALMKKHILYRASNLMIKLCHVWCYHVINFRTIVFLIYNSNKILFLNMKF